MWSCDFSTWVALSVKEKKKGGWVYWQIHWGTRMYVLREPIGLTLAPVFPWMLLILLEIIFSSFGEDDHILGPLFYFFSGNTQSRQSSFIKPYWARKSHLLKTPTLNIFKCQPKEEKRLAWDLWKSNSPFVFQRVVLEVGERPNDETGEFYKLYRAFRQDFLFFSSL